MKKICALLLSLPLLMCGCGNSKNDVVIVRRCWGISYVIDQDDPQYVDCEFYRDVVRTEKEKWRGIVNSWVVDNNLGLGSFYWCEYSDGMHIIAIGCRSN